jgi:O-antigen/teichoic acid export membrane protein
VISVAKIARRVASGVSLYAFALLVPRVVRLVTLPLVVNTVSPSTYGAFATLWPVVALLHSVCDLGIGTASLRLSPERETVEARRSLFATAVSARAVMSLVVATVVILAARPITRLLLGSDEHASATVFMVLALPAAAIFDVLADEMRSRERHRSVAFLTILRTLGVNGATVVFVVLWGWGITGLVLSRTVVELLLCGAVMLTSFRYYAARPNAVELRRLVGFGAPFGLLYLLITFREIDRVLIRMLTSVEHVAAYDLAMRVVAPVSLSNVALAMVLEPHLYRHATSPRTPRFIELFLRSYVAVFGVLSMALVAIAPEIFHFIAPRSYAEGVLAFPTVVFAYVADGLMRTAGVGADLAKRTRVWVYGSLTAIATSLPLTWLLVPPFGVAGAGAALLAGLGAGTVMTYGLARRVSPLRLPVARCALVLCIGAALGSAMLALEFTLPVRLALLVLYAVAAFRIAGVHFAELIEELGLASVRERLPAAR